jgi:hypothetical protein
MAQTKITKALKLYDFINSYCNESAATFDTKYPEWEKYKSAEKHFILDYINETFIKDGK